MRTQQEINLMTGQNNHLWLIWLISLILIAESLTNPIQWSDPSLKLSYQVTSPPVSLQAYEIKEALDVLRKEGLMQPG